MNNLYSFLRRISSLALLPFFMIFGVSLSPALVADTAIDALPPAPAADSESKSVQECPTADRTPDQISIDNDPNEPLADYNREIKELGTKFVVKEFFKSKDTLFNFMKLTYQTIDDDLKAYKEKNGLDDRSAFFMFKGGNVMRIIANGVFSMLPPEARDLLQSSYQDIFTRSDADFSIFIDDQKLKDLDYEKVLNDLTKLTYDALNKIRDEFSLNPETYFNFSQLKSKIARLAVNKYLDQLKELPLAADVENPVWYQAKFSQMQLQDELANPTLMCKYEGQRDVLFDFAGGDQSKIIGTAITDKSSWIQNSINRTLGWPAERDPTMTVKFHLVRAKVAFEYTFMKYGKMRRKAIGGELIDVSFPHKDDFRLRKFLNNYDKWVADYTLTLDETGEVLPFKAESIEGLTADIAEILFEQQDRPWNDVKFKKRMNRLFFFGIAEMLGTWGLGSEMTTNYLDQVREKVVTPLKSLYPLKDKESAKAAQDVLDEAKKIADDFKDMKTLNHITTGIAQLALSELVNNPKEGDEEKFKEFLEVVLTNLDIISKLATMQPRIIDIKNVYNAKMDHLL